MQYEYPMQYDFSLSDWMWKRWWFWVPLGLFVTGLGSYVFYDSFTMFAETTSMWYACVEGRDLLFGGCGALLTEGAPYRFGINAVWAMLLALVALFLGPMPLVSILSRFRNNWVSGTLFILVVVPYSMIAFLVMMLSVLALVFSLLSIVS